MASNDSEPSPVDAATSDVFEQSDVFDAVRAPAAMETASDALRRRISYFMLFRLAMLAAFTALAAAVTYTSTPQLEPLYSAFVWISLGAGFAATVWFARQLRRTDRLDRLAWSQTSFDILAAAVVVQMTGGVESGFVFLFLIAILGAAMMGGPRSTWAAAGACAAIWLVTTTLDFFGFAEPMYTGGEPAVMSPVEHWTTVARTIAAMAGVTVLSSYLNTQLASSTSAVVDLRALNENIVRSLSSGLLSCSTEGRVVYFNPAAREILELEDADLGRAVEELLPGAVPGPTSGEIAARDEVTMTTAGGRTLHIGLSQAPLRDGQGQQIGTLVIFQDLTELHELAEQVRRSERLAALGKMAASVAHEIRNPLAAISGSAELLGSAELGEEDERLLSIIRRESGRLSDIVTDLLAFTRPRKPQTTRMDLARVAREACEAFGADPANRDVEIGIDAARATWIEADAVQVAQVLWNLLRNAAEAMGGRGHIDVAVTRDDDDATLTVTDDGPGVPVDLREQIFDPFFTTKEHGTGFGLAIAHRVTKDNGGTLELDATVENGSRFELSFAVAPEPSTPRAVPFPPQVRSERERGAEIDVEQ